MTSASTSALFMHKGQNIFSITMHTNQQNRSSGFSTRFDTNRPVQSQKMARSLKFWIEVEKGLYYLSSKNKGADQLRSYCEAVLHLCFRIGKYLVFS